jgi:hypothetical protein
MELTLNLTKANYLSIGKPGHNLPLEDGIIKHCGVENNEGRRRD